MVHERMIRTCPLFAGCERKFIAALSTVLQPEVYLPAQFIVIAGYVSRSMYFIKRGRVQIIRKKDDDFLMEECHDFFDVLGLFTERQHTISVRSVTQSPGFLTLTTACGNLPPSIDPRHFITFFSLGRRAGT